MEIEKVFAVKVSTAVGVVAAATCTILAWLGQSSATSEPSRSVSSYLSTQWVTYSAFEQVPPNDRWPDEAQALARNAAELVDYNKGTLLGSYINASGRVVVASGSPIGDEIVERSLLGSKVILARAPLTVDSAAAIGFEMRQLSEGLAESIYMWGGKPQIGGLIVVIRTDLSEEDQKRLDDFATEHRVPMQVELQIGSPLPTDDVESRFHDLDPYVGGSAIELTGSDTSSYDRAGACSTGFAYRTAPGEEFMLTAGHCFPKGNSHKYAWTYTDSSASVLAQYVGWRTATTWEDGTGTVLTADNQNHGDLALIKLPATRNANGRIWWGVQDTTTTIPVLGRFAPTVGDKTCINGRSSGSDCGTQIQDTNVTALFDDGTLRNGDRATSNSPYDCSKPGDSGGSVILDYAGSTVDADAVGIIKGHLTHESSCEQWFTGIEEANQAWGGELQFAS